MSASSDRASADQAQASTYRVVTVTGQRQFALVERERHEPSPGQVRIRVEACGICHTDVLAVEGLRPDPSTPIVPGHEIIGVIEALGDGVDPAWRAGDRVGVGFLGGQDNTCHACRRGDFVNCSDQPQTGTGVDGGYAEVAYARATGLVRIPPGLDPFAGAPLLCAGLTMYKALISASARPGSLVAVQGIGGLGHLGIQYARALGHRVVAITRGAAKAGLAAELGAHDYIDSTRTDPGAALRRLGGAAVIVATAASGASMSPLVRGLDRRGELVVVGAAPDPIQVSTSDLIFGEHVVRGSLTGTAIENEDNLRFVLDHGIRSSNEVFPLSEAPKAYERMINGDARFRIVLDPRK
ncbi:alcohol dehydrogenase catalytic domain-containing protein [Microbispora triticiradicis]|uniref:alcohol dehydrogenase catalytic domain-containing protein n=1 Tax=Microbispora triticiradicis TaxID=2200763 RepID=UPI001AD62E5F|nr:alcohol dehydrogenase catalytic domain-containing protein [Microbispora triticiradicis]MBO4269971.1 alcohol dehydrogenase catalytic domain-containing protein [Microbispora triticiradicis]